MDLLYLPDDGSAYSALTGEFGPFGESVRDGNHGEWHANDDD
jgi:hypothetical protein